MLVALVLQVDIHLDLGRVVLGAAGKAIRQRHQLRIKIVQPLAMLGGQPDRFAQPQRPGFDHTGIRRRTLALVGGQDHMRRTFAQDLGKHHVHRSHPGAGIDHEQADIGHVHRPFRQAAHPALKAVVGRIFQPRRVDHGKAQIAQPRLALAQIARHAGLVVDQRQLLADKTVEQGGFAHIGPPHNGERETHGS